MSTSLTLYHFDDRQALMASVLRNGAGKTTAITFCRHLLMPDSGEVKVAGFDVVREDNKVRSAISLTGQFAAVDDLLTGAQRKQSSMAK